MKKITTIYALVIDPAKAIFSKPMVFTAPTEEQIKVWKEYKMQVVFLNEDELAEVITALNSTEVRTNQQIIRFILAVITLGAWIMFLISTIK